MWTKINPNIFQRFIIKHYFDRPAELLIEVKKKDIRGGFDLGGIKQKKFC